MENFMETLQKIVETIMSNPIWVTFGLLCVALFFSFTMSSASAEKETESPPKPYYLEIHYGNGDVYTVEVDSVVVSMHSAPRARLKNDYTYRFDEAYTYWREETDLYIKYELHLWRDKPYALEKELFTKIRPSYSLI